MNVLLAHASGAPIHTSMGQRRVDFQEVLDVAENLGAEAVFFPRMAKLARRNLAKAVEQTHPNANFYEKKKFVDKAKGLLGDLLDAMEEVDPPGPRTDIDEARALFKEEKRDLSGLVTGRYKDPIPEDEDLEIMVQASHLDAERVFILSMDAHFVGYADILQDRWGFEVIDPRERPMLAEEWRT